MIHLAKQLKYTHFTKTSYNMNTYSKNITEPIERGVNQAMLYALGLNENDLKKPHIGICLISYESNPCNAKLNILANKIKDSIKNKNLLPFIFNTVGISDGIAMGTIGMNYSLPSREIIANSIETHVYGHHYDGMVCIPGCDKNLPGSAIALARLNIPGFIIYGGSMPPSFYNNQKLDIISAFEYYGKFIKNEINNDERLNIIKNSCNNNCGSCSGMYTTNTMSSLFEVMGLTLPNSTSNPSMSYEKFKECDDSSNVMKILLENNILPSDIFTKKSFINAISMLYLTGGSTNAVIHLLAIAKAANVNLSLRDFTNLQHLPVLLNLKPHGLYVMNDLHKIGGLSVFIKFLIDNNFLYHDILTITGKTLYDNVKKNIISYSDSNNDIIRSINNPIKSNSHIKILYGNLAPNGCVSKSYSEKTNFIGTAITFDTEDDMLTSLKNGKINKNHCVIIRYQGIGMSEMSAPTSAIIDYFGKNNSPMLLTDGGFSGGSHSSLLIAHLPNAFHDNSPTALIQNNDIIIVDLIHNKINISVSEEILILRNKYVIKPKINLTGYGYMKK